MTSWDGELVRQVSNTHLHKSQGKEESKEVKAEKEKEKISDVNL